MRRIGLILAAALASSAALAQGASAPANVNDCTLIQDPVELRNCILRFEGNRTPPPAVVEAPPLDAADTVAPARTPTARSSAGRASAAPATRRARLQDEVRPPPTARDTLISIEQIQVPPSKGRRDP